MKQQQRLIRELIRIGHETERDFVRGNNRICINEKRIDNIRRKLKRIAKSAKR